MAYINTVMPIGQHTAVIRIFAQCAFYLCIPLQIAVCKRLQEETSWTKQIGKTTLLSVSG